MRILRCGWIKSAMAQRRPSVRPILPIRSEISNIASTRRIDPESRTFKRSMRVESMSQEGVYYAHKYSSKGLRAEDELSGAPLCTGILLCLNLPESIREGMNGRTKRIQDITILEYRLLFFSLREEVEIRLCVCNGRVEERWNLKARTLSSEKCYRQKNIPLVPYHPSSLSIFYE